MHRSIARRTIAIRIRQGEVHVKKKNGPIHKNDQLAKNKHGRRVGAERNSDVLLRNMKENFGQVLSFGESRGERGGRG